MSSIPSTPSPKPINERIDQARPSQTKPPAERPAKTPPSAPKEKKDTDKGPLPETKKAAIEGAQKVKKAIDAQPTPERAVIAGGIEAAKEGVNVIGTAAKEVAGKVAEATKPIHEPFTREIKEAGREIGEAGAEYGKSWFDSLNPFDEKNVKEAWENAPTPERGVVYAGWEALKNIGSDAVENAKNLGELGLEVLEGTGELIANSPGVNAVKEGVKGAIELGKGIGSWFGDRIEGGAEGAVKAGKTLDETNDRIEARTAAQDAENDRELGEAADNFKDNLDGFSEVSEAWESAPTPERAVVYAGWEILENSGQALGETVVDGLNYLKEDAEAFAEDTVTAVQNLGDTISGGFEAAGDFVGGLFG